MEAEPSSSVTVARILKPHGISGEVVLESLTDVEGRLEETSAFLLIDHGRPLREVRVESRRFFHGRYAVKFNGVDTRSDAESLRGMELAIPEKELGSLPSDHFFIHQLVGMSVRLRNGKEIGKVKQVLKTAGVDLLEVGEKAEILIPFVAEICVEVDVSRRQITIDPPEGLLQLNAR